MAPIIVAAKLPTAGDKARQSVLDCLTKASQYSKASEPGVLKYMVCAPADSSNSNVIWAIEEYADQQALDDHMATTPVKDMVAFMSANPTVLEGPPTIRQLSWVDAMQFTKPEVAQLQDPLIVFVHLKFHEGKRSETLKYWKGNLEGSRGEEGTLSYGILEEAEKSDDLFTLEVYKSEAYLADVHVKSDAVQENIRQTSEMRKGLELAKLKLIAGYVERG